MRLQVLGSGSKGNCYLLSTDTETLILDAGISVKEVKKALDFNISRISGLLVTHVHKDHSQFADDFFYMGIPVIKPYAIKKSDGKVGSFIYQTFDLPHDDTENYGYYIKIGNEKILYLTDFEYCKYNFSKLKVNHILVECNYQDEYVSENLINFNHKIIGHCSLETCKEFVRVNASEELKNVILIHLGDQSTNKNELVSAIKEVTNANVYIAQKGLDIEL